MQKYDHKDIEKKWQQRWEDQQTFAAKEDPARKKAYILDFFPYPSGAGLHVGHPMGYIGSDIISRKRRMEGFSVLHPMGWDAFGLPAENYAIKMGVHPRESIAKNAANFRRQLQMIGLSYDWSREINSSDPAYYRWTQWLFLFLYKRGLAYKKKAPVNWCENDHTVLANEQVVDGKCERCGHPVVQKDLSQWFFRITNYADRLIDGLDKIDWPDKIKAMQTNWIGRSEGAKIRFGEIDVFTTRPDTLYGATFLVVAPESPLALALATPAQRGAVEAYKVEAAKTTELDRQMADRPKTGVFTGSFVAHPLTGAAIPVWVADYVLGGYGTGAIMAVPAHDERDHAFAKAHDLPIITVIEPVTGEPQQNPEHRRSIVALVEDPQSGDVLSLNWGKMGGHLLVGGGLEKNEDPEACARREIAEETGYTDLELVGTSETIHHNYFAHSKNVARQIDAVGLHFRLKSDVRAATKHEAAEQDKFAIEWLTQVEAGSKIGDALHSYVFQKFIQKKPYTGRGVLTNSGADTGKTSAEGAEAIIAALAAKNIGERVTTYRLRDWLVSRQRYWGAPIPIIYCDTCGEQPVPEELLPVLLPEDVDFRPTGESPLARSASFHDAVCPNCAKPARRETDTLDGFVCSSWYFLRFASPHEGSEPFNRHAVNYWCPVDLYVGGAEHAVLHLLFARFVTMALSDHGVLPFDEPFPKLRNQGLIMGENGEKMSKSKGNVVNPDDVVAEWGADTLRVYEMFMGEFGDSKPWSTASIVGVRRFLDRVWLSVHDVMHAYRKHADGTAEAPRSSPELTRALHKTVKKVSEDIEAFKFNTAVSSLMILMNDWAKLGGGDKEFAGTLVRLIAPFAPHLAEELWCLLGNDELVAFAAWPGYDAALVKDDTVAVIVQVNGKVRDKLTLPAGAPEADARAAALASPNVARTLEGKEIARVVVVQDRLVNIVLA